MIGEPEWFDEAGPAHVELAVIPLVQVAPVLPHVLRPAQLTV